MTEIGYFLYDYFLNIGVIYMQEWLIGRGNMMNITDQARDLLLQVLKEQDKSGIRVYFAGYG